MTRRQPPSTSATPQMQEGGGGGGANAVATAPTSETNQPVPSAPQLEPSAPQPVHSHPRQFLGRSHSIDLMVNMPGRVEEEEEGSGTDESPPHADVESVLQPLAAITLDIQGTGTPSSPPARASQDAPRGVGGVSGPGPSAAHVGGASPSQSAARPQLSTALQRAVSDACVCMCICVCMCVCVGICVYVYVCVCWYMCVYVYVCVC